MPDGDERAPSRERRGIEPAVLAFLRDLVEAYDRAHRREHEIQDESTKARIELAAERLEEVVEAANAARNELRDRITEHYDTVLAERDTRYGERFNASQSALKEAAKSAQEAVKTALETAREETNKTEENWVKTADATFVKIEQMQMALSKVVPREESDKIQKEQDRRMGEQDRRITVLEAAKAGKTELLPWIIAAVAVAGLLFQLRGRG